MLRLNLSLLLVFVLTSMHSQIVFENGYFINNVGEKTECLIKNKEWKNNPSEFEYKLRSDAQAYVTNIDSIAEFGIGSSIRYIRATVDIDQSSDDISRFSNSRAPEFKKQTVFLKVVIEGKASLYFYENKKNIRRYFFKVDDLAIEQLVFKHYFNDEHQIRKNSSYKQQLLNYLTCDYLTPQKVRNIDYRRNDLIKVFVEYNTSHGNALTNFYEKQKRDRFNFRIRPGINYSTLSIYNSASKKRNTDFGSSLNFRFGLEAEFVLPFNKNKWAIFIEPSYHYFKSDMVETTFQYYSYNKQYAQVDYNSIEVPIGLRHYFFINEASKVFINGAYVLDFSFNSTINFEPGSDLEVKAVRNYAIGAGYEYKNKFSVEFRANLNRDILNDYLLWEADYKTYSIIFGYAIF